MPYPDVSIVVPTFRRPRALRSCLGALAVLDYPQTRQEVIVVNDGGAVLAGRDLIPEGASMTLRVVNQSRRGPAYARNIGASLSRGEYVAFTDDDCMPSPEWLKSLALRAGGNEHCAAGGRTVNQLLNNPYAAASQMMVDYLYGVMNQTPEKAGFLASNNVLVPKEQFVALGGFDTGYKKAGGEDRDLCRRWNERGYKMVYVPDAVVLHAHDLRVKGFLAQHFTYGQGANRYHRGRTRSSQRGLESLSFYVKLVRFPLFQQGIGGRYRMVFLMALSQAAAVAGFAFAACSPAGRLWRGL